MIDKLSDGKNDNAKELSLFLRHLQLRNPIPCKLHGSIHCSNRACSRKRQWLKAMSRMSAKGPPGTAFMITPWAPQRAGPNSSTLLAMPWSSPFVATQSVLLRIKPSIRLAKLSGSEINTSPGLCPLNALVMLVARGVYVLYKYIPISKYSSA